MSMFQNIKNYLIKLLGGVVLKKGEFITKNSRDTVAGINFPTLINSLKLKKYSNKWIKVNIILRHIDGNIIDVHSISADTGLPKGFKEKDFSA